LPTPGILHHQGREGPQPALFPPTSQNVIVPVDRALPVELTQVPADMAGPGLACESGGRAHCQLVPRNSGCEIVNRAGAAPKNGTNGCGGYARHPSPPPAHPPGAPLFPCARARRIVPHVGFVSDVVAGFESVCGRGGRAGRWLGGCGWRMLSPMRRCDVGPRSGLLRFWELVLEQSHHHPPDMPSPNSLDGVIEAGSVPGSREARTSVSFALNSAGPS